MANQHYSLVDKREVFADEAGEGLDLGAYKSIVAQIQIHSTGTNGDVCLQHAAVNENGAFTTLGTNVQVDGLQNDVQSHANFLRYVRFSADSNIAGHPIVSIDIVVKER